MFDTVHALPRIREMRGDPFSESEPFLELANENPTPSAVTRHP